MRRDGANGLGIGVVIAELLFFGRSLSFMHRGGDDTLLPQMGTKSRKQICGFAKALGQNVAGTFERGFGTGMLTASEPTLPGFMFITSRLPCWSSVGSANNASAKSSSPASRAICARVRRLGL